MLIWIIVILFCILFYLCNGVKIFGVLMIELKSCYVNFWNVVDELVLWGYEVCEFIYLYFVWVIDDLSV